MNVDLIALLQSVPWLGPYLPDVLTTIGIAAMVAAQLPPPSSAGGWYAAVWRVLHWIAQNYRHATPAAQPPATSSKGPPAAGVAAVLALLLAAGSLSACGNRSTTVLQAAVALTAAEQAATAYIRLPPCPAAKLCSDAEVIAKIKAADNVAYAAVKAADTGTTTPEAAMAAVSGLLALIPATSN